MSILRSQVPPPRFSGAASGKLAVIALVQQQVFAEAPWRSAPRYSPGRPYRRLEAVDRARTLGLLTPVPQRA